MILTGWDIDPGFMTEGGWQGERVCIIRPGHYFEWFELEDDCALFVMSATAGGPA